MKRKGFTLIELIIAVIIIGILASLAVPMMRSMQLKAICAEAITGLSAIRTSFREYYVEYGTYPAYFGGGFPIGVVPPPDSFPGLNFG